MHYASLCNPMLLQANVSDAVHTEIRVHAAKTKTNMRVLVERYVIEGLARDKDAAQS